MEEKTDKELYHEFLQNNQNCFEEIIIRHKDKLIYFIERYVKSIEIAEDIAQDVFVYILIHRVNYDFQYSLKTYLYTIAKSKALNYIKREKRIVHIDEIQFTDIEELEDKVFKRERESNLRKSIKKLKIDYQNAIYLADFEKLSYKEIGEILQKNNSQVKILVYRARRALEKIVRKEELKYEE